MGSGVNGVMTAANAASAVAAQGATALTTAQRVGKVAQGVPMAGAAFVSREALIAGQAAPLMFHQRFEQYMAPFGSLPVPQQADKALQFISQEIEEVGKDLFLVTGPLSPDNFDRGVRGFMTSSTLAISKIQEEMPELFEMDPLLLGKVKQHLIDLVGKFDDRKLFSAQQLSAIFDANMRLWQRMSIEISG